MTPPSVLRQRHLDWFAAASGDLNPLHVDAAFARRTSYGRTIAQGALGAVLALRAIDGATLRRTRTLCLRFAHPIRPDEQLHTSAAPTANGGLVATLETQGRVAVRVLVTADAEACLADLEPVEARGRDRPRAVADSAGEELAPEPYAADLDALRALAAGLGAGHVPDALTVWLAGASYVVGMLSPGRDALFASARMVRADARAGPAVQVSTGPADPRTGLTAVRAKLSRGPASASLDLRAFSRAAVPAVDRVALAAHLPPSEALAGRHFLVVGATRGLGAALATALVTQGAVVWAAARSTEDLIRLRAELGERNLRPLTVDATDPEATHAALRDVAAKSLAGVVLCAAPAIEDLPLTPAAVPSGLRYVEQGLAAVLSPLTAALPLLLANGLIAFVSSSAVESPPTDWAYYVTVKAAVEGLAIHCASHLHQRVAVLRPPKMLTDMTNGPLGALGALPADIVAASFVRWVLEDSGPSPCFLDAARLSGGAR